MCSIQARELGAQQFIFCLVERRTSLASFWEIHTAIRLIDQRHADPSNAACADSGATLSKRGAMEEHLRQPELTFILLLKAG